MSKFGKALKKIQEERNEPPAKESSKPSGSVAVSKLETFEAKETSWEKGIATIKNNDLDNRIVTARFPDSVIAEQYRMLRTSFKTRLARENAKVILVSSAIHSEGKTITAVNLGVALAETGDVKVAIVDADLRRGKLADYLGFGNRQGLTEFLQEEKMSPKQVMVRNSMPNLLIMPRGEISKKPSELISSSRFHTLIAELRATFDYVLIDAPPIMSVADAGILAREVDGVLFIIQAERTPKSVIAHAEQLFREAGTKILGFVLTHVEFQAAGYRYYNYYYAEHQEENSTFKRRVKFQFRKAGEICKDLEEKFNQWWGKKVLKKEGQK